MSGQGYPGGTGSNSGGYADAFGGGGGGAASAGLSYCGTNCDGRGGNGRPLSISGAAVVYGAGGGGVYMENRPAVVGAPGGSNNTGGQGGVTGGYSTRGGDAVQNSGSGGGGGDLCVAGLAGSSYLTGCFKSGATAPVMYESGHGANGIVIVSYPTGTLQATGGQVTASQGNTIHTFKAVSKRPTLILEYYGPNAVPPPPACASYTTYFSEPGFWQTFGATNVSGGKLNVTASDGATAVLDLEKVLGEGEVLGDSFVARLVFHITQSPGGNYNNSFIFSLQSDVDPSDPKDYRNDQKHEGYYGYSLVAHRHNSAGHESWLNALNPGHPYWEEKGIAALSGGPHYIELVKSGTNLRYRRYENASFLTVTEEFNKTVTATLPVGIRYVVVYGRWNGSMAATFDNIEIHSNTAIATCEN